MLKSQLKFFQSVAPCCIFFAGLGHASAAAALISGPSQISASTTIPADGFGSVGQIVDGIDLNTDGAPFNGFGPNSASGIITLDLTGVFTIYDFILANDINVDREGVKEFRLSFYDASDLLISTTGTFTALGGTLAPQTFSVGAVSGVSRVDFEIFNVYTENLPRIEIREVAFNGEIIPEPSSVMLGAAGALVLFSRRKRA